MLQEQNVDSDIRSSFESGKKGPGERTSVNLVDEVDRYRAVVAGVNIESVRTGRGIGPNRVVTTRGDGFVVTGVETGFPSLGRTTLGDDEVALAAIRSAPPGARFCEIDLEPGLVLAYGPGAEHTGVNPVGYEFVFTVTTEEQLESVAESVGWAAAIPSRGEVRALPATPEARYAGATLSSLQVAAAEGVDPVDNAEDDLLHAIVRAFARPGDRKPSTREHRLNDRTLVLTCIEYAKSIERIPSVSELCTVCHVSERRLRLAFNRTLDVPPTRFFRIWGLNEARRKLLEPASSSMTVTEVAAGIGFAHLARFSGRYKACFGELPSQTLHAGATT